MEKIISFPIKLATSISLCATFAHAQSEIDKPKDLVPSPYEQKEFFIREEIPLPKGEIMEIGSIALMSDRKVAVSTRRGDIWICSGAYEPDLTKVTWKKAYDAAHEPLGMHYKDDWLYITDRSSYGRIADKDNDGTYESYELISDDWGTTGNYHEYVFGSTPDKEGNIYTVNCLTGSWSAHAKWRGWGMKIAPDGKTTPFASGVRSPGGIGFNAEGDVFYTDNQGTWNGTSCLKHLKEGSFTGNPLGNVYYKHAKNMGAEPLTPKNKSRIVTEAERIPQFVPPAVQIPHGKVGQSPTAIITDLTNGKFSAFDGQILIGEQTHSEVQRIYLEKVNGVYQGAVWKMLEGFRSGIVPMKLSNDGTLFIGGTNRGWAARGGKNFTFERVRSTGVIPFEMKTINATPNGFKISFTHPVNITDAGDISNYNCNAWTYIYQDGYGSPEIDKLTPKIISSKVSKDAMTINITLDKLTKGHVHHFDLKNIKSKDGKPIWHPNVYYTLNQIPKN